MPPRDWKIRIQDILDAIKKIDAYTQGATFDTFSAEGMLADAVIYNMAIIGEATCHIPDVIAIRYQHIPWPKMRAMRNVVIHEYFGISLGVLWQTTQQDLPRLATQLQDLLRIESAT